MTKTQKDTGLGKGIIFFAVVGILAALVSSYAGFYGVISTVSFVIAALLGLLWWINFANRKKS
ncbi:hypothetical protein ACFY5D_03680 [Paeniglutamicibacter sp. NPDC012692]|uniref:hypothetical protein n=1 Tax=Paeniglutamicibacter sp. NPDC012692 TaxID=3364388 RepID=UPI0036BAEBC8